MGLTCYFIGMLLTDIEDVVVEYLEKEVERQNGCFYERAREMCPESDLNSHQVSRYLNRGIDSDAVSVEKWGKSNGAIMWRVFQE